MLQRVHIQILDNPMENVLLNAEEFENPVTNRALAENLRKELNYFYPSVVFVEYIDLFMDGEEDFDDIRELLSLGAITTPVVLINGVLKIHGGISTSVIKKEVERLISSGPVH
ncbi:MAG: thioredoxin family protein [Nitrospirota bacterium]|nr:thioredoxin family protein [Nitrospirota bacterium]MDH5767668.1 thioredoxin family protein [Nitrospirota bacterium]